MREILSTRPSKSVNYTNYANYANVIAGIICVGVVVTVLDALVNLLIRKTMKWTEQGTGNTQGRMMGSGMDISLNAYLGSSSAHVVVPDGVREIRDGAFRHCVSFERCELPAGVEHVGEDVFIGCWE